MDFNVGFMKLKVACNLCLLLSATAYAMKLPQKPCNKIKIENNWYDKEIFYPRFYKAYNLNLYRSSNALFFSFSVPESSSDNDFRLGYYNLDTREYQAIYGIRGGCSIAIDQVFDEIYLGGCNGIYKYNMQTKLADYYREKGKNIWSLFFKKNLFYISYPDQKLYIDFDGKFSQVKEFKNIEIDQFHVSTGDDIYYSNKTGFYNFNSYKMEGQKLLEEVLVRQIAEDNEGFTYICTNVGLYRNYQTSGFKKIYDAKNIYGIAFDIENNIIISNDQYIFRLKKSAVGCRFKNNLITIRN